MITIKKNELELLLVTISAQNKAGEQIGLLHEKITLGMKRKLQKLFEKAVEEYKQLHKDKEECEKSEDKEKELTDLFNEEINIDVDKLSLSMIESIESSTNYDFHIIEKIAE